MKGYRPLKGYKGFKKDFTCKDGQFSENSEHKIC